MNKHIQRCTTFLVLLTVSSLLMAGETEQETNNKAQETSHAKTVGAAGMVYTTDQDGNFTDQMPQELRDGLSEVVNTSSEGLTEKVLEDGTVMVDLKGRFQSAMVMTIDADGKLKSSCLSSVPGHQCAQGHQETASCAKKAASCAKKAASCAKKAATCAKKAATCAKKTACCAQKAKN